MIAIYGFMEQRLWDKEETMVTKANETKASMGKKAKPMQKEKHKQKQPKQLSHSESKV